MQASLQLYTRTTAQWAASPDNAVILKPGQPGIELRTDGKFSVKIGNGVNVWAALNYSTTPEIQSLITDRTWKQNVRGASVSNVAPLSGLLIHDNVDYDKGERILLKDQTDPTENGIWVTSLGAWTRAVDFETESNNISGAIIKVNEGDENKYKQYLCSNINPLVVGTDPIEFYEITPSNYSNEADVDITGLTTLDLTGKSHYDVINLISTNPTEDIEYIIGYTSNKKLMLRPKTVGLSPLVVTFKDHTISTPGNIFLSVTTGTTFAPDSSAAGYIELQRRGSDYFETGGIEAYN